MISRRDKGNRFRRRCILANWWNELKFLLIVQVKELSIYFVGEHFGKQRGYCIADEFLYFSTFS